MKGLISIADYTLREVQSLLDLAVDLSQEWLDSGNPPISINKFMPEVLQKPGVRTRVLLEFLAAHVLDFMKFIGLALSSENSAIHQVGDYSYPRQVVDHFNMQDNFGSFQWNKADYINAGNHGSVSLSPSA